MKGDSNVSPGDGRHAQGGERIVYVMPSDCLVIPTDQSAGIGDMLLAVWRGKWQIFAISLFFAVGGVAYALLATEWYRAETVLSPAEAKVMPDLLGPLGGLASLAGVSIGGGDSAEPVAVLRSRDFASKFIEDMNLTTVLLAAKWDAVEGRWKEKNPKDWPDIRDAVTYFDKNVRFTTIDRRTGMVTLAIRWKDPIVAAEWANLLVKRLNDRMRERAIFDASGNVSYLQSELSKTNVVTLQQSIGRVLETEMQRLMLARGNQEFAFRVIDPAKAPRRRSEPKRVQVVLISTTIGFALAIALVLVVPMIRGRWLAE